jgi:hypothetical protein
LVFRHILTDGLRSRPDVRPSCNFGSQDTSIVLYHGVIGGFGCDYHGGVGAGDKRASRVVAEPTFGVHGYSCTFPPFGERCSSGEFLVVGSFMATRVSC